MIIDLSKELSTIVSKTDTLIYYEGPALFTGFNKFKNRVLGLLVDFESDYSLYLYTIVGEEPFYNYLQGDSTLYQLIESGLQYFYVKFTEHLGHPSEIKAISFPEINQEHLPDRDSFYPYCNEQMSFRFAFHLSESLADQHQVKWSEFKTLSQSANTFIDRVDNFVNKVFVESSSEKFVEANLAASFELVLRLNVKIINSDIFTASKGKKAIEDFAAYLLTDYLSDQKKLLEGNSDYSNGYREIEKYAIDELANTDIVESLNKSLEKNSGYLKNVAHLVEKGRYRLDIKMPMNKEPLLIDSTKALKIIAESNEIESIIEKQIESTINNLDIIITKLDVSTGEGQAIITSINNEKSKGKYSFQISNFGILNDTKYSKSLHHAEEIHILGRFLKGNNGKIKKIFIDFKANN